MQAEYDRTGPLPPPKRRAIGARAGTATGTSIVSTASASSVVLQPREVPQPRIPMEVPRLESDCVLVPRGALMRMIDNVERVKKACEHAVDISIKARDTFEAEMKRVHSIADDLQKLANRGHVI